jgi:hypothetical protein
MLAVALYQCVRSDAAFLLVGCMPKTVEGVAEMLRLKYTPTFARDNEITWPTVNWRVVSSRHSVRTVPLGASKWFTSRSRSVLVLREHCLISTVTISLTQSPLEAASEDLEPHETHPTRLVQPEDRVRHKLH